MCTEIEQLDEYLIWLQTAGPNGRPIRNPEQYCTGLRNVCRLTGVEATVENYLSEEAVENAKATLSDLCAQTEITAHDRTNLGAYINKYIAFVRSHVGGDDLSGMAIKATAPIPQKPAGAMNAWKEFIAASEKMKAVLNFGTSNVVGDFAEWLCVNYYNGQKVRNSQKGIDFRLGEVAYQVKARKFTGKSTTTQLSAFRSMDFDILVVVLFNPNGTLFDVREIPITQLRSAKQTISSHVNATIFTTDAAFLQLGNSLKEEFQKQFEL